MRAQVVLIATGSEVELALKVAAALEAAGHRRRCRLDAQLGTFDAQDAAYRADICPPTCSRSRSRRA
jgi:transketolase